MRIVTAALVFWLAATGSSRAGYVWLGPWQVDAGTAGSSLSDAGAAAAGVTGPRAQGGGNSSVAFSRQFEVTDAPAGGLHLALRSDYDASVVYFPRSFGDVVGSVAVDGDPTSAFSFHFIPPAGDYGQALTTHGSATRELLLADGIYTLRGSLTSSAVAYTNPFAPATSAGGLTADFAPVPEPSAALLTVVGVAGMLALRRRL